MSRGGEEACVCLPDVAVPVVLCVGAIAFSIYRMLVDVVVYVDIGNQHD